MKTPKLVGVNHVALRVNDLEATLAFWRSLFDPTFDLSEPDRSRACRVYRLRDR
jgi:catechol 2,3-dioxygenase-like lactoylglutathione lyase family enzyme